MSLVRRILLLDHPQETRFFAFVAVFAAVIGAIYWVLTYEVAGTVLLLGFSLGAAVAAVLLWRSRPRAMAIASRRRGEGRTRGSERGRAGGAAGEGADLEAEEGSGGGTAGIDRPFGDERGRLPDETLAPLALGFGVALALTAVVFGPWLLVAGVVPIGWGAWAWLSGASDELEALTVAEGDDGLDGAPDPGATGRDAAPGRDAASG